MPEAETQRPLFWGLTLSVHPEAHVLVVDDSFDERRATFERICAGARLSHADSLAGVESAFDARGEFDVYFLDFNMGDDKGGWIKAAQIIRQRDRYSVAKPVIIHSTNNAGAHQAYADYFPAAFAIQWDVLRNIAGGGELDRALVDRVLSLAGSGASGKKLREISIQLAES